MSSPWLAPRPGELPHEQMARIRNTCRWCGEEFPAQLRLDLYRHERAHVNDSNPDQ